MLTVDSNIKPQINPKKEGTNYSVPFFDKLVVKA